MSNRVIEITIPDVCKSPEDFTRKYGCIKLSDLKKIIALAERHDIEDELANLNVQLHTFTKP